MNEQSCREITQRIMRDGTAIVTNLTTSDAWLLLGAIQQTLRYPIKAAVRMQFVSIATQLQTAILRIHPEAKELIADGWDFVSNSEDIKAQINKFLISANDPSPR